MFNKAIQVLNIFREHGYRAYIVGGYPRDKILGIKTNDIDICTDAKPKEIIEIFDTDGISDIKYGAVRVIYKGVIFDVTTFRRDIKYENNRKPIKIKYVTDLKKDLLRRDFTINTICIDSEENIIDLLNARVDIDNRIIKTVGNPRYRLKEDSLRILRAIRFAACLDFEIDYKTKSYIKKYGYLLNYLSNSRKREELDKIFAAKNKEKGRRLIIEIGIDKCLGLDNLSEIELCDDIIGIWSQLNTSVEYPFSKVEKENINKIRAMLSEPMDNYAIYLYGLYVSSVVGNIKHISYQKINKIYSSLPIKSRKEIALKGNEIATLLNKKPGNYIKDITEDVEKKIIYGELENNSEVLKEYVILKYGG